MNPWIQILLSVIPELPAAIQAIRDIFKKYPQLTPEQIQQILNETTTATDAGFDAILAKIAADQAKQ